MLSQAAVNRIAEELLEQARASKFGFTDPSGIPVPPRYRCRDLKRLPQGLQQEIVRRADLEASYSPWFILAMFASIGALFLPYGMAPAAPGARLLPYAFPIVAPLAPLLFRAVLARRAVKLIARRVAASWPVSVRL